MANRNRFQNNVARDRSVFTVDSRQSTLIVISSTGRVEGSDRRATCFIY